MWVRSHNMVATYMRINAGARLHPVNGEYYIII